MGHCLVRISVDWAAGLQVDRPTVDMARGAGSRPHLWRRKDTYMSAEAGVVATATATAAATAATAVVAITEHRPSRPMIPGCRRFTWFVESMEDQPK